MTELETSKPPAAETVNASTGAQLANPIRHIPGHPEFNANIRQLLHVSFKLAAKAGARYTDLLNANEAIVAKNVTENIYERHMKPLFIG